MSDQAARDRIRGSLDESLMVEASAGTGKTSELVRRIVALVKQGRATVDRIVAVTFTRKAAGELKLRLRQELDQARLGTTVPVEAERLEHATSHLEEAKIGTIHSFCADILRARPVEARIAPGFDELDERQSARLFAQTFNTWIQETLRDLPPGLWRALGRVSDWHGATEESPFDRLRGAAWRLAEWRDFDAPWRREPFDRIARIDELTAEMLALAAMARTSKRTNDQMRQALRPVLDFAVRVERTENVRPRDHDELEAGLLALLVELKRRRRGGAGRGVYSEQCSRVSMIEARDRALGLLDDFKSRTNADLAALLREELWPVVARYETAKQKSGHLDFGDLLIRTRDLLRDHASVRHHLQRRFSHILVDEFQDSDPVQIEIILLLTADDPAERDWKQVRPAAGKLFLVGDPKQSIYRFRRADVLMYREVREHLEACGVSVVNLSRTFRTVEPLQELVNSAFASELNGDRDAGQPEYVPLTGAVVVPDTQPSVVALPVAPAYGKYGLTEATIAEALPHTVAAFADWVLRESGWTVRDPSDPGRRIPVAPHHICILFRHYISWSTDTTRPYVHALEARDIPHLLSGARSFHQREEVENVRAALAAVEWPDDELSVYATLRGPLFAISDHALLKYRHHARVLHPFRIPEDNGDAALQPVRPALETLARLHRRRNWRPVVETVHELLESTRAHAGFALRPAGNQVLANVYRLCDLARRFDLNGGLSFRSFVMELEAEARRDHSSDTPVVEDGAEGVRLMTVHTAKGLEFPVVLLADITTRIATGSPDRHIDSTRRLCAFPLLGCSPVELHENSELETARSAAEGVRIAYVAATRARDLLIIPVVGDATADDKAVSGWVRPLNRSLYPARDRRRISEPSPGCPDFGEFSFPAELRPEARPMLVDPSVRPGRLHPERGDHTVTWWDPALLGPPPSSNFGVRQIHLLRADAHEATARESEAAFAAWRDRRGAVVDRGALASFDVFTASGEEASPEEVRDFPVVQAAVTARVQGRPSGVRFGTLVHAVLKDAPLSADAAELAPLAEMHGRLAAATRQEIEAATRAAAAALKHPLLQACAQAEEVRRELPLVWASDAGRILEGVIDLAYLRGGVWTVIDFKTDVDARGRLPQYQRQVGWYCLALGRITNQPVRGWLLSV